MRTTLRQSPPGGPEPPGGQLALRAPPRLEPNDAAGGVLMNAIPLLGSLGSIGLIATLGRATGGRAWLAAGLFLVATVGFFVAQLDRQRRQRTQQVARARTAYLHYLAGVRTLVREAAGRQRRALCRRHPDPAALPCLAAERSRVWERAPCDTDFLHVRYAVQTQPLALELVEPESAPSDVDPAAAAALHRLVVVHRRQPGLPASIDLRAVPLIEICGAREPARALARSLICSAAAFHAPEHLVVAVATSQQDLAQWDWVKWLPHALSADASDAAGPRRMVSTSPTGLAALLPDDLGDPAGPHVLLVTDGAPPALAAQTGVTRLDLSPRGDELPDPSMLRLRLEGEPTADGRQPVAAQRGREEPVAALADQCTTATAEALARRLAPLCAPVGEGSRPSDLPGLLGLDDVRAVVPPAAGRLRPRRDRLRVPIGLGEDGAVVHLDLKESAQHGMGPHGLVIGATGSGKSELLRTLVLGLALTHPPEQLNLVLVDFKGGATFAGLAGLPHVSALITNLARELTLVDRMQDALSGELVRRQELLRAAGNLASVGDYERACADDRGLAPLPSLLVVVDEFSELLSARPDFIDVFVAIGRLGRSLGLHLLLASQRLEEGRLRGLESHLSYRVGLRTFSAAESRAVLGIPDAHELPAVPGLGYLRPDPATLTRFRAAYVSGPPGNDRGGRTDGNARAIFPFTVSEVQAARTEAAGESAGQREPGAPESLLDLAVRRLVGSGRPAHRVWLPPLDLPDTLDGLMDDLTEDPALGLVSPRWRASGGLVVPLGTADRPREQRRETLTADLARGGGHVAVVGGPRSGKSTLLRTILAALSLTTTPHETQVYVLDFGGGTFASLAGLPHVAGVGTRVEPDVVRRVLAEVRDVVDRRETHFRAHGLEAIETYRSRRAAGAVDDGHGDLYLVVDGWSTLRADFEDLEAELQQLATRGPAFGLHVVAGAARWADFRPATRDLFGTRLELRLGDPVDSDVDRRAAALVPAGRPGRGLVAGPVHFLAALPRIDGDPRSDTLGDGLEHLVARVTAAWTGPAAPRLRLLPERIELDTVRAQARPAAGDRRLLLGVDEQRLAPVGLDPDAEPHLLVLGEGGSGKSNMLRGYLREVVRTRTPQEAQLVVVDFRRSLLGEVPDAYLLDYLTSAAQTQAALDDLARHLLSRLPGPDATAQQLRDRSWWSGAEAFVVIDDYDLVATPHGSWVQALQPLVAQARDTGLHVVIARRSGGASRALHEPLLQALCDLAVPGLLLSGRPDEGPLVGGQRPRPATPGRGRLVSRGDGVQVVQVAWCDPRC